MDSFLLQQDSGDLSSLGFKRDRGVSLGMDGSMDMFPGLHEEPTTMSGMSTNSEDEGEGGHSASGFMSSLKRKFSCVDGEASAEAAMLSPESINKMRRIERQGADAYAIDGQQVPRLQLGESGRAQLKAAISAVLKRRPDLRKQCNAIQKVKNASIVQLLAMARICGIWEQAVRISESFLRRYPCKKTAGCGMSSGLSMANHAMGGSHGGESCGGASSTDVTVPLCSLLMMGGEHQTGNVMAAHENASGMIMTPSLSIL